MSSSKLSKSHFGFYLWLLQVFIVLSLLSVVMWFSLHPKNPSFTVVGFDIPAFEGRNSTNTTAVPDTTARNTTLVIKLQISNPNKGMGIYYDETNVTLHHGNEIIGVSSIPGFYQGHKKIALKEVGVNGIEPYWKPISKLASINGKVSLRMSLMSKFRYRILCSKTRHHWMELQANVTLGSDGKIVDRTNIKLNQTSIEPKIEIKV